MKSIPSIARRSMTALFASLLLMFALSTTLRAQTTTFTYQGHLTDSTMAANGTYDFQFALYVSATVETQTGVTNSVSAINVAGGVFTVQLNFGATTFQGADRYLEIRVNRPVERKPQPAFRRQTSDKRAGMRAC